MILLFLFYLLICTILHESAHLIACKLVKCKVEVFSIGFWKPIWKKKIKGTVYQITPYLVGGYCKLKGELSVSRSKDAFTNLPYLKKLAIIFAGVFINILTGVIVLYFGRLVKNFALSYFGWLSIILGITNCLPIPPLDGAYPYLLLLEKPFGKKKGYKIAQILNTIGFYFFMLINILSVFFLIYYFRMKGGF